LYDTPSLMTHHVGNGEHKQLGRKKSAADSTDTGRSVTRSSSLTHIASRGSGLVDGAILTSSEPTADGELVNSGIRRNRAALAGGLTAKLADYRSQYSFATRNKLQTIMKSLK
jgi:hypothetical protein